MSSIENLGGEDLGQDTSIQKVALASAIGATIEWYDFFVYGTAAGLIFNKLFFTSLDPVAGTLAAYASFAAGFVARPLGGIIFGHFGDKIGRKTMLVMTLLIMGIATFIIGLLPTYNSIGIWAPILLLTLRVFQGIGVGGEWGGAVLMAVEHSPEDRRGYWGSWAQIGVPAGLTLGTGVFALLSLLPEDQFYAWGWRLAFLLSIVLVAVGLYIRLKIAETPAFSEVKEMEEESQRPFVELLRTHPKELLLGMGTRFAEGVCFNIYGVFAVTYLVSYQGLSNTTALTGVLIGAAIAMCLVTIFGRLTDRFGRRPIFGAGVVLFGLSAFPAFWLFDTRTPVLICLALAIALGIAYPMMHGPQASFYSELFNTRIRYSGVSFVYQFSGIFASGLTPLIATALLAWSGNESWAVIGYMVLIAFLSLASLYALQETFRKDISYTKTHRVRAPQPAAKG